MSKVRQEQGQGGALGFRPAAKTRGAPYGLRIYQVSTFVDPKSNPRQGTSIAGGRKPALGVEWSLLPLKND